MTPGSLAVDVPLPASRGRRKIELRWAGVTQLGARDPRSAAARLTFLGVVGPPSALPSFPAALTDPGLAYSGVFKDGWSQKSARFVLAGGRAGRLDLRAQDVTGGQRLEVRVNGRRVASQAVEPGQLELRVPIPASRSARTVELRWAKTARIAPNDPRQAAALLQSIAVVASAR